MSQDELHVTSEEVVFEAAVRWVKHEREAREAEMPRLLTCVRLPLVTPQFLSDKVATEELVRSSHKCRCVQLIPNNVHTYTSRFWCEVVHTCTYQDSNLCSITTFSFPLSIISSLTLIATDL